jgi:putative transcription antitermination factor YqgF
MNILAVDYGRAHIGLAFADSPLAQAYRTVAASAALDTIVQLVDKLNLDLIIIGISEGQMAQETKQFATKLRRHISTPLKFHDETLSSQEAKDKLHHSKKKVRSGPDHHYAAALILQDYLDHHSD